MPGISAESEAAVCRPGRRARGWRLRPPRTRAIPAGSWRCAQSLNTSGVSPPQSTKPGSNHYGDTPNARTPTENASMTPPCWPTNSNESAATTTTSACTKPSAMSPPTTNTAAAATPSEPLAATDSTPPTGPAEPHTATTQPHHGPNPYTHCHPDNSTPTMRTETSHKPSRKIRNTSHPRPQASNRPRAVQSTAEISDCLRFSVFGGCGG